MRMRKRNSLVISHEKNLVFLFAFILLVACIRVTGLFRRLLQRHFPWGKGKIVDHFPDSKLKVVSSFPAACGYGKGGDDLGRIYTPK